MKSFRVRLNCIDHYQAVPTRYDPQLRNDVLASQIAKGPKVPVIRIFGSTETGQKVCAHVHGAFPYLYVEYDGGVAPEEVGAYIYRLHLSIDHALAVSYRRDQFGDNAKFVARITLVKGIPFYGFHVGFRFFLKIYMFNPIVMTRLADLLQQGVIMKQKFQPYEAHLQYLLQFMVDYNLYGCDYLESSKTKFRSPVPEFDAESDSSSHLWHSQSVLQDSITDDPYMPRVSHCSIEVDICVQHITNRRLIRERPLHHDFIERNNPIPGDLKLVHSMAGLWRDEAKRRQRQMPPGWHGQTPFPPEVLVTMSADPRQSQPQGWIHEQEYRDQIEHLIEAELSSLGNQSLQFEDFVEQVDAEAEVPTSLQSVEDLYPRNLRLALGLPPDLTQSTGEPASSIEVDEKMLHEATQDEFFPEDSDEEALRELLGDDKNITDGETAQEDEFFPRASDEEALRELLENDKTITDGETALPATPTTDKADDVQSPFTPPPPWLDLSSLGLGLSVFKTGILPQMPVLPELLDFAEDKGLVGRAPKSGPSRESQGNPSLKRRGSMSSPEQSPRKRFKAGDSHSLARNELDTTHVSVRQRDFEATPQVPTWPVKSSYSEVNGGSVKSYSEVNFGHATVKSNPSPEMRSSQPSQLTSTGPSLDPSSYDGMPRPACHGSDETMLQRPPSLTSSLSEHDGTIKIQRAIHHISSKPFLIFSRLPPTSKQSLNFGDGEQSLPDVIYQDAYYSKESDVPERNREYAGREYHLESNTVPFLSDFDADGSSEASFGGVKPRATNGKQALEQALAQQRRECTWRNWEFAQLPPSAGEVKEWWDCHRRRRRQSAGRKSSQPASPKRKAWASQIDGPTPRNKHGFKYSQKAKTTSVEHEVQYMSTMSLEIHVNTRGKYVPNPEEDEVQCIFWACKSDEMMRYSQDALASIQSGIVVLAKDGRSQGQGQGRVLQKLTRVDEIVEEESELDLIVRMVEIVRTYDPDVLTGYEVHGGSWGFLIERARLKYDYNLCDDLSRMKSDSHGRFGKQSDRWGFNTTSTIRVTGRHMINIWRAMRGELNLGQYTLENVAWHLLHRRVPHYSWKTLTSWYKSGRPGELSKVLTYYLARTAMDIEILETNELIPRISEQARLLGVDFFSVFSRGSQFKVESIMFRIGKPENLMFVSPSRKQVGGQNALECLPLVMEPQSAFYTSPVLVLDFQSLYPSIMIAYNYCYSTFLGRITNWRGGNKMGFTEYKRQQGLLALLRDHINIAPNGIMYVKTEMRKSLLAKMLTELLETRVMVKSGMKRDKDDKVLQQLLNNRQLALKLLANVTYGYTSASFSGRMPCSEMADSIVQTGRETLERATAYIHSVERWGAEVVYGDTDSLFVHLKGRTREQAFDIGEEMARAITDMNPRPIKLKFEKVYQPCVLLAKKRYVGYKYESREQARPDFDAKGIETVRRDGTPAEQKMEEKALRLLFETCDLSQVKDYFQKQCDKMMRGAVSVQDFCFAKEVRLGTYSDRGGPPPAGAVISAKKMLQDARAEPQYGERVPYVVMTGAPGARLVDRCVAPEELVANPHWQLDADYYISKNLIPPLERIFNLVGANVRQWYDEMPKVRRIRPAAAALPGKRRNTLESYMRSAHCLVCGAKFAAQREGHVLCGRCRADERAPASLGALQTRLTSVERAYQDVLTVCRTCSGLSPLEEVGCDSKDCPVFWTRTKERTRLAGMRSTCVPAIRALEATGRDSRAALEW